MRFKKLLVIGTAVVAVIASVTGAALASGNGRKAPTKPVASVTTADSDNIQEGDQTSPDAGMKASEPTGVNTADENPGDGENSGESDGPGGHQDAPGQDVNHEFDGQE